MILGKYRAPRQEREIKPEKGDVHVARVDAFKVGSCVPEVDLTAFDHEGQPHLPWKDMQKGPTHMSTEATFTLFRKCNFTLFRKCNEICV